jgi:hypothetical protein
VAEAGGGGPRSRLPRCTHHNRLAITASKVRVLLMRSTTWAACTTTARACPKMSHGDRTVDAGRGGGGARRRPTSYGGWARPCRRGRLPDAAGAPQPMDWRRPTSARGRGHRRWLNSSPGGPLRGCWSGGLARANRQPPAPPICYSLRSIIAGHLLPLHTALRQGFAGPAPPAGCFWARSSCTRGAERRLRIC